MPFTEQSIDTFVTTLASSAPIPGGGGASALVGAIGMALGNMVGSLTVGKKKYADVEQDIIALMAKADVVQKNLLGLMDKDAEVFEPLTRAYCMPRETEEDKAKKAAAMEIALKDACAVPLEIMRQACAAIELHVEYEAKGSNFVISDIGVGAALCKAALLGGALNVFINTKSMQDRVYADPIDKEAEQMLSEYGAKADLVYEKVTARCRA